MSAWAARVVQGMIGRLWHGSATPEHADAYERLLRAEVLPGIDGIEGHRFAGDDYESAVVLPEARALLDEFDERSAHYEVLIEPDD